MNLSTPIMSYPSPPQLPNVVGEKVPEKIQDKSPEKFADKVYTRNDYPFSIPSPPQEKAQKARLANEQKEMKAQYKASAKLAKEAKLKVAKEALQIRMGLTRSL